jgi:hypothetical protein
MYLQDLLATGPVGQLDRDAAVEPPRSHERRVENFGPVGGAEDYDGIVSLEAVHLGQDLI